jgi:hypothetical protein
MMNRYHDPPPVNLSNSLEEADRSLLGNTTSQEDDIETDGGFRQREGDGKGRRLSTVGSGSWKYRRYASISSQREQQEEYYDQQFMNRQMGNANQGDQYSLYHENNSSSHIYQRKHDDISELTGLSAIHADERSIGNHNNNDTTTVAAVDESFPPSFS